MSKLTGKVAVIIGGSSGIGLATAKLFRSEGARVAISGRDQETLQNAMKLIGGDVIAVRVDVSQTLQIEALFRTVVQMWSGIDIREDVNQFVHQLPRGLESRLPN